MFAWHARALPIPGSCCRSTRKTAEKQAVIDADEWAKIFHFKSQIGKVEGVPSAAAVRLTSDAGGSGRGTQCLSSDADGPTSSRTHVGQWF